MAESEAVTNAREEEIEEMHKALNDIGFESDQIEFAIQLCEGRKEAVIDYLLNRTDVA